MNAKEIGVRIRRIRAASKLNQETVAEILNISCGYYSHLENGDKRGSLELYSVFSDSFKVSLDYLIKGSDRTSAPLSEVEEELFQLTTSLSASQKQAVLDIARVIKTL